MNYSFVADYHDTEQLLDSGIKMLDIGYKLSRAVNLDLANSLLHSKHLHVLHSANECEHTSRIAFYINDC